MAGSLERERDESGLIDQICQGQTELFQTLIKPYERAVFAVAYSVVNNSTDAEEIAQEAFLNALKGLKNFRAEAKFSTWLIQIALNEARMRLRRSRTQAHQSLDRSRGNEDSDFVPRDFADWREIPSEALARKELRQIIEKTLLSLRPNLSGGSRSPRCAGSQHCRNVTGFGHLGGFGENTPEARKIAKYVRHWHLATTAVGHLNRRCIRV